MSIAVPPRPEWETVADGGEGLAVLLAEAEAHRERAETVDEQIHQAEDTARESTVAGLRWRQQRPNEPQQRRIETTQTIRRAVRELYGPLPWVRRLFPCTVLAVDRANRLCTVAFAERDTPLPGCAYYEGTPQVDGAYVLHWPVKLPDDPTVPAQPRLWGRPWIKVEQPPLYLYYQVDVSGSGGTEIYRIPFPPTDDIEREFVRHFNSVINPGGANRLVGYHRPTQRIVTFNADWIRGIDTPTDLIWWEEWGFGAETSIATGKRLIPTSVGHDYVDAEDAALMQIGAVELERVFDEPWDLGVIGIRNQTYYKWMHHLETRTNAASWTLLATHPYEVGFRRNLGGGGYEFHTGVQNHGLAAGFGRAANTLVWPFFTFSTVFGPDVSDPVPAGPLVTGTWVPFGLVGENGTISQFDGGMPAPSNEGYVNGAVAGTATTVAGTNLVGGYDAGAGLWRLYQVSRVDSSLWKLEGPTLNSLAAQQIHERFIYTDSLTASDDGLTIVARLWSGGGTPAEDFLLWSMDGGETWEQRELGPLLVDPDANAEILITPWLLVEME